MKKYDAIILIRPTKKTALIGAVYIKDVFIYNIS